MRLAAALIAVTLLPTLSCKLLPRVVIEAPTHGDFVGGESVEVSGFVDRAHPSEVDWLTVNGQPVELDDGGRFHTVVSLDPDRIFQPIDARMRLRADGSLQRDRVTLIRGEPVPADSFASPALALRLTDGGLAEIAAEAGAGVASQIDLGSEIFGSNPVATEKLCVLPSPFGGCLQDIEIEIDIERVDFSKVRLNLDARHGFLRVELVIRKLEIEFDTSGIKCEGRLQANRVGIPGDYTLAPDPDDPTRLDANLVKGSLSVDFEDFEADFTDGVCDAPLIGDLIDLIVGEIEPMVSDGLKKAMKDPDGKGREDSLIAEGLEDALDPNAVWAALGEGLGVAVDSELMEVVTDRRGVTLIFDAQLGPDPILCERPDGAPAPTASLAIPGLAPVFGDLTPGGLPFDTGIAMAESSFNQMLRAGVECGLLRDDLVELDLGSGILLPLNAGLLGLILPALSELPPETPIGLSLRPQLAPVLTGRAGPAGEAAELEIGHLVVELRRGDEQAAFLSLAVDLRAGLDLALDPDSGDISMGLGSVPEEHLDVAILRDRIGVDESALGEAVAQLVPLLLPSLGIDLGPLELPELQGLDLEGIEVQRDAGFLGLYFDLISPLGATE